MFPSLLERRGLIPALSSQLDHTHPQAVLDVDDTMDRRLDRAVEAAAYLFCVEVAPSDRRSHIDVHLDANQLIAAVTGDAGWADDIGRPGGTTMLAAWQHSRDRVAALDGEVLVNLNESGMAVTAVLPLDAAHAPEKHGPPVFG